MNSIPELSEMYGVSARTLQSWASKNDIHFVKISGVRYYSLENGLRLVLSYLGKPEVVIAVAKQLLKSKFLESNPELFKTYESKINLNHKYNGK